MKFNYPVLRPLMLLSLSFLFACSKTDDTNTETEDPAVLVKADYYPGWADTSGLAVYSDSIYYNDKNQIEKVISRTSTDSIVYLFTYNSNDLLTKLTARGAKWWHQDYNIYYSADNRVDSLNMLDSSNTTGGIIAMKSKLYYDQNDSLSSITTDLFQEGGSYRVYKRQYTRKGNGDIDSINIQANVADNEVAYERNIHPSAILSPVNKNMQQLNPAYLFLLATRVQLYLFTANSQNIFMQHLLCPGNNLFNDGTFNNIHFLPQTSDSTRMGQTYINTCALNGDGTVKTYQYVERPLISNNNDFTVKFYYSGK